MYVMNCAVFSSSRSSEHRRPLLSLNLPPKSLPGCNFFPYTTMPSELLGDALGARSLSSPASLCVRGSPSAASSPFIRGRGIPQDAG